MRRHIRGAIFVRDDDQQIVAGINGGMWGGYLEIKNLWVCERLRGRMKLNFQTPSEGGILRTIVWSSLPLATNRHPDQSDADCSDRTM